MGEVAPNCSLPPPLPHGMSPRKKYYDPNKIGDIRDWVEEMEAQFEAKEITESERLEFAVEHIQSFDYRQQFQNVLERARTESGGDIPWDCFKAFVTKFHGEWYLVVVLSSYLTKTLQKGFKGVSGILPHCSLV